MRSFKAVVFLVAMLLSTAPAACFASPAFAELLQDADKVRSSDPKQFKSLLGSLEARKQGADTLQSEQLRYLQIYSKAVYGNQLAAAITDANILFGKTGDPDLRFRTGSLIANLHTINRNFGEGLKYLDQTMAIRHQVVQKDIRHDGINTAATLYDALGQHRLVLRHAEETLADSPGPRARCVANYFRVSALSSLKELPVDDVMVAEAIQQCADVREYIAANLARFVLARKWAGEGRHDEAIALLRANIAEVESIGYARLVGELHSLLAELLLAKGDIAKSKSHAQAALAEAAGITNSLPLVMAYKVMYEISELRHDPVAALSNYRNYAEADKAYLNEVKARELVYQISRQENAQKTQQIELLDQQNQVLQLQQRVQKQANQNMGLVVVLLTLLVAGIGYWAYKVKRLHLTLRRFAETDALTEISNRHHFTQQAQRSLEQCEMAGESAAVIMFDLDRFKTINDTYGHDAGDWVLRHVATTCASMCRRIDQLGRVGGEEFAILLHGCELNAAVRLAEDCRVRLSQTDTRDSGHTFAVTASFGVSSTAMSGYVLSTLMSHADLMLYRAKREGRNRVRAYRGDVPVASPHAVPSSTSREVEVAVFAVAETPVSAEIGSEAASESLLERRIS